MPTITSAGVGSGLDVAGLVEKLVAAEGEPVKVRLDRKEVKLQAGLSAMGTFKGAVAEFQSSLDALRDPDTFGKLEVTSSDEEKLAATAGQDARPGEYEIEVLQLARAHKLSSASLESDRLPLGTGSLTIQLGRIETEPGNGNRRFVMNPDMPAKTITIDEDKASLRGIEEAINKAGAGVRASVINDGNGYRLVLSSLVAGNDNSIRIKVNDGDGTDQDMNGLSLFAYESDDSQGAGMNMNEVVATRNAELNIDGIFVSRSSNDIDDVIDGVTLSLKPDAEGSLVRINIEQSTAAISEAINGFVGKYNELIDVVDTLTGYDPETKTAGPLSGDASIRGVISQIRRTLSENFGSVNPNYDSLSSIGIDTGRDGKLTLDTGKLQRALDNDLQQVVQLFSVSGSSSDPAVRYLEAGDETRTGAYELVITRMASQGAWAGGALQANGSGFPLRVQDGDNRFRLRVDGLASQDIELTPKLYRDEAELLNELQNRINADTNFQANDVALDAFFSNGRILLVSRRYGGQSAVEMLRADAGLKDSLGFRAGQGIHGEDVAGSFANVAAIGSGRTLTGKGAAEGLKVEVLEGEPGERGKVFFSHGIAARLHELVERFLGRDGIIGVRTEGYNDRIAELDKEREKLAQKLKASEQRYLKQFTALDATLGKMRSTGNFLSNQLSSLPGAAKQTNKQ